MWSLVLLPVCSTEVFTHSASEFFGESYSFCAGHTFGFGHGTMPCVGAASHSRDALTFLFARAASTKEIPRVALAAAAEAPTTNRGVAAAVAPFLRALRRTCRQTLQGQMFANASERARACTHTCAKRIYMYKDTQKHICMLHIFPTLFFLNQQLRSEKNEAAQHVGKVCFFPMCICICIKFVFLRWRKEEEKKKLEDREREAPCRNWKWWQGSYTMCAFNVAATSD